METVGLVTEDTEKAGDDSASDIELFEDAEEVETADTFVQMTGIINDERPAPPPAVKAEKSPASDLPKTGLKLRALSTPLIPSPGYAPTPPTTEIIAHMETVSHCSYQPSNMPS